MDNNKKKKETLLFIALFMVIVFLIIGIAWEIAYYTETKTDRQISDGTYIEKNVVGVDIPDGTLYIDKRLKFYDRFCLALDMDWLYKCKLYKDFGWYGDTYMVYTSIEYIRRDDVKGSGIYKNAYYLNPRKNNDKYIFFWNQTDESLLHELAHFADDTHGYISSTVEWRDIYYSEWTENEWLHLYKDEKLKEDDQEKVYLMESFAEGFAQWYCDYYKSKCIESCSEKELERLSLHVIEDPMKGITKDEYPLTYAYMADFYENYKFSEGFMRALDLNYTSIE